MTSTCEIQPVGKRRDGGTRYWCTKHRANATAKYGVQADQCVAAQDEVIGPSETYELNPKEYPGGVALWGAVPAVYSTTSLPLDRGLHIHARKVASAGKVIDQTFRRIRVPITDTLLPGDYMEVDELDAINFMVSSVFDHPMKFVSCTLCGFPHLDRDWFAVHKHKRHLCHGCGRQFSDVEAGIGNPAFRLASLFGVKNRPRPEKASGRLSIKQADFPGGIQIWGSNPAIVWTSRAKEQIGIHVHAYKDAKNKAMPDGTFQQVEIDGININANHVRTFMAQCAMPHIRDRVVYLRCTACKADHFDVGELAYTPHMQHECDTCGATFSSHGRVRLTIGNPFVDTRKKLERYAVAPLQSHYLDLRAEAI